MSTIQAKRTAPNPVEPVSFQGIRYFVPGNAMGVVEAQDEKSAQTLWINKIYSVSYDPLMETDVQWVFITKLEVENGTLVVTNESEQKYKVDLKTGKVISVQETRTVYQGIRTVYLRWMFAGIVIIILTIIFMFNPFKKSSKYEVVETKTFSCEGMTGFTFDYPVFKDWEPVLVRKLVAVDGACAIFLSHNSKAPNSNTFRVVAPNIEVQKISRPGYSAPGSPILEYPPKLTLKNPQGIPYQGDMINSFSGQPLTEALNSVEFYTDDYAIKIKLVDISSDKESFSRDLFFKTVIESFRLATNKNIDDTKITEQQAREIAQKEVGKQGADLALFLESEAYDFGFVFHYNSKKYMETKNVKDMIPGLGPLVVTNNYGGVVQFLGASPDALQNYINSRKSN